MIKLSFCQNDPPIQESFWQKDSLITCIIFELCLFLIFSPVANFGHHPLCYFWCWIGLYSQVIVLRQIWIVNFYVKCLSDNLSQGHKWLSITQGASSNAARPTAGSVFYSAKKWEGNCPPFPPSLVPVSVMKTKTLVYSEKWYFKYSIFLHFNSRFVLKHLF